MSEKHVVQLVFLFGPEEADQRIEDLLAEHGEAIANAFVAMSADSFISRVTQVCAWHTGTTVGPDLRCPMCDLDEAVRREHLAEASLSQAEVNAMLMRTLRELEEDAAAAYTSEWSQ